MKATWILRKGSKESGFRYVRENGKAVSREDRERIAGLGIPPAWREVQIAGSARAPIQAWGLDDRGRRQYRYHVNAVQRSELRKHYRVRQLARELPRLRARFHRDTRTSGYSPDKVAAGVVLLIAEGFFRVGSERHLRENRTFGITTLRKSHVRVHPDHLEFRYVGKLGKRQRHVVADPGLSRFVRTMMATPGARLFRYRIGSEWVNLNAEDVNDYLKSVAGFPYTAKDLRTLGGTLRAATVLADLGPARNKSDARRNVMTAVRLVAADLGNTAAICRKSYVHPMVLDRYVSAKAVLSVRPRGSRTGAGHSAEERALVEFLDEHFPERRKRRRTA